jgi:hypothetical protein
LKLLFPPIGSRPADTPGGVAVLTTEA